MLQLAGLKVNFAAPSIVLPVGISFYTFQTLSYTLDVYFGKTRPWHSFLDYALYVTFFPQLVAGPIVRATTYLPQCTEPKTFSGPRLAWGVSLLVLGLFEKIAIADGMLAPITETVFDGAGIPGFLSAWCGTLAFAGQIFCDFGGYSTCAIGAAMCLGFDLPDNFHFPMPPSVSLISGRGGTSPCRPGCGTTSTSLSAATGKATIERIRI